MNQKKREGNSFIINLSERMCWTLVCLQATRQMSRSSYCASWLNLDCYIDGGLLIASNAPVICKYGRQSRGIAGL